MIDAAPRQRRRNNRAAHPAWLVVSCALALVPQAAVATDYLSEDICGDGIDNDNSGAAGWGQGLNTVSAGDATCSGVDDKDHDGYTTTDCDDNNRWIFPGVPVTTGCSAGEYKLCQSDGSYGSCHAFTCSDFSSTNSCYFIATTGSDSAAGSSGAPWLTFGPITQNDPGGGTTRRTPTAGDTFILRAGTYSTNKDTDNGMLYINSKDGTSSNRITIMSYPGEVAQIASNNTIGTEGAMLHFVSADYWDLRGLEFEGGYGDAIFTEGGSNIRVIGNYFNAIRGATGNNFSSVKLTDTSTTEVSNNLVYDGPGFLAFRGTSHDWHNNVLFLDDRDTSPQVSAMAVKHGADPGGVEIDENIFFNYARDTTNGNVWTATEGTNVHHNLFHTCGAARAFFLNFDPGSSTVYIKNETFDNNTVVNCNIAIGSGGDDSGVDATGPVVFTDNVIKDDSANYTGTSLGLVALGGDASAYAAFVTTPNLTFTGNLYYNASVSGLTSGFELFPSGGGSSYNFAGWQAIPYDTAASGSYEENPSLTTGTLVATSTHATGKGWKSPTAIPAFCGDTVRGMADHACTHGDADRDGEPDATDCDPNNMFVFTGTPSASGCSAGEIKTCQADGTYTACSAPTAKWIDCDAASNGDGSYATPWNTLQMVAYFYNAGSRPAGWYDIAPGDRIFVQGTCSDTYDVEGGYGTWVMMLRGGSMSGSSGSEIKFEQWPGGAQWVINPGCTAVAQCGNVYLYQTDFVQILGVEITGTYGSSGIFTEESDDLRISRNYIHDIGGSAANNSAGIVTKDAGHARVRIDHNVVVDTYDSQQVAANENNANVTLFKPDTATVDHNVLGYSATTGSSVVASGTCLKFKHGMNPSGTGPSDVSDNVCFNSYLAGFRSGQPEVTFANNLVLDSDVGFKIDDAGGTTYAVDNVIEYNTVVGSSLLKYDPVHRYNAARTDSGTNCGGDVDIGLLTARFNVTVDDDASYGSNEGFISVGSGTTAAQDSLYADVVTDGMLSLVTNNYWNSAAAGFRSGIYEQNNGTTTCGSGATGNNGAAYSSFANWQAAGWDAGSENTDPSLNSDHIATAGDAVDWGWAQDASPGPTPTPSPSPTPTPVPTGTFDIGPTLRNQIRIR